ncbi:MAG: hypothetical protein K2N87_00940 [Eubacterium sp.]|nr:hypothetical protein [Eubacterium sp.]
MEKDIFQSTILDMYPSYVKKAILKQAVDDGFVINNKKHNQQLTLNFNGSVDVTEDETLEDKFRHMLERDSILAVVEDYEYRKPYKHFCYFKYLNLTIQKIEALVKSQEVNIFDRKAQVAVDDFGKPTIYILGENIYFKFSYKLKNDVGKSIKYVILAIIDKESGLLEIRFDRVGIAYRNSNTFYKDKIYSILQYFNDMIGLQVENIDFKAVVEYMKSEEDDITIIAQRMTRNGTTAYLEAYEDEAGIIPILGELESFLADQKELFDKNSDTQKIRRKLKAFITEIEVKSDMPMVKIRMDRSGIKFGITHNYKDADFSLFMLYGELVGEELMGSVKEYLMRCYKELNIAISTNALSAEENK